jgi:pyruvate carboxylase
LTVSYFIDSLIGAIREKYPDLPIHVHSHDTAGIAAASMLACAAAGADVVDVAIDSALRRQIRRLSLIGELSCTGMSGLTSQPSMGAVVMALEQTDLGTGIRYEDIQALNLYWSQVRMLYSCFEANVRASDSSVFDHEMPGGQYTNLMVRRVGLCFQMCRLTVHRVGPSFSAWSGDAMVE